ncbi:hypothetical protein D0Z00_001679 [Geotrichum galactomycetum]|uniref:Uncharacterized protein n=1 Tax=Geotrichum galactomycetum TaxID=27317 RepID=A0ACB6V6G0_9ASCO|nr:hypothetical protein D0Z00_001679 [Geotrichum candidum]
MYLMSLDDLDETILNAAGKEPVEVARTPELAEAMQVVRAQYTENVINKIKSYFSTDNIVAAEKLLSTPRAKGVIDINGQIPETGSTYLFEFAKARNAPMVKFILDHGGDPFKRNSRGVLPVDATKDESIRRLIKEAARARAIAAQQQQHHKVAMAENKGISLTVATETSPTATSVNSETSSIIEPHVLGPPPKMKGFLKKYTNIKSGYKLRWFVLENGVLSYYKRQDDSESARRGLMNMRHARIHVKSSEKLQFEVYSLGNKFSLKANHPAESSLWLTALENSIQYAKEAEKQQQSNIVNNTRQHQRYASAGANSLRKQDPLASTSHLVRHANKASVTSIADENTDSQSVKAHNVAKIVSLNNNEYMRGNYEEQEDEEDEEDSTEDGRDAPYGEEMVTAEDSVTIGLNGIATTVQSMRASYNQKTLDGQVLGTGLTTLEEALKSINSQVKQYIDHVHAREFFFKNKIEKNDEIQAMWTKTISEMEEEKDKLEGSLHRVNLQRKRTTRVLRQASIVGGFYNDNFNDSEFSDAQDHGIGNVNDLADINVLSQRIKQEMEINSDDENTDDEFFDALASELSKPDEVRVEKQPIVPIISPSDTDTVVDSETSHLTVLQRQKLELIKNENSNAGYEDPPRTRLAMDVDDRPKISLWGVLKNLIGKDMTRMTLPVSFNECTNLLMRSAEDMEYTDLLDTAASLVNDPGARMVYIAAYAASSYSSTIDRIAKPFNPLLGETFEYCRPDKGYRMFSEQVSHHPPVGALMAESAKWDFYGASNVKSKFNGRSFEINPTGLWYITLRPNKGEESVDEEVYSFRKVTSSVVGIITGSPTVDNHGYMEITNHTLGYKCKMNFKSRGWRGANAYEVKGTVVSNKGIPEWIVGGKWSESIFARRVKHQAAVAINTEGFPEHGDGSLDKTVGGDAGGRDVILVWKAHPRPKAPFNLTSFAITLNALPQGLQPWLAPTDTRLRPDQRAMEEGRYDDASDEKFRVEEKQRAARRQRESEGVEYRPRWFRDSIHPITKQPFWEYKGDYWQLRRDHKLADKGDIF